jgi:hypothetical protein
VVAAALPALARPIARIKARRYGVRVQRRLGEEAVGLARESVEPARGVLHEYARARAALLVAAGQPAARLPGGAPDG